MLMILVSFLVALFLYGVFLLSNKFVYMKEKLFSFECGFNPFCLPRSPFSVQFFKVLLMFLLFDMEIIIILPFCLFFSVWVFSYYIFMIVMFFLFFGLLLEWVEGALDWLY